MQAMLYAPLRLKSQQDRRIKGGHLWIYSNEIDTAITPLKNFQVGQLVSVQNHHDQSLGIAYINPNTLLCARLLTRNPQQSIEQNFFEERIQRALQLRQNIFTKLFYRCVFGESDFLPGVVIDRYNDILVVQITTAGMEQLKDFIIAALKNVIKPKAILLRNDGSARKMEGLESYVIPVFGEIPELVHVEENQTKFLTSVLTGQKTGWFYDHRDNRARMQKYIKEKHVLDIFSYIGAWGIQAAMHGAKDVLCIDSSAAAIQQLQNNAKLNQLENQIHVMTEDAFVALKNLQKNQKKFDVIILDPPAFIKKRKDIKEGFVAYQRLNEMALQLLATEGILISSSCSLHLSEDMLLDVVRRAAIKNQRNLQILERGFQALDHPVHPAIIETAYLKTLFCRVF